MIEGNAAMLENQPEGKRYKQLKISVDPFTAASFKEACATANTSMAAKLAEFMVEFTNAVAVRKPLPDYSTKRQRRAAVSKIIKQLEQIRDCEQDYCDRIPENLQNSVVYEKAEEFLIYLETAIDALVSIESI